MIWFRPVIFRTRYWAGDPQKPGEITARGQVMRPRNDFARWKQTLENHCVDWEKHYLDAAADYGKHLPASSGKLFVTGFCWGGGKSFLFATHRKDLSAAFVFYGPPPPADAMKNINAPVYGFYAGNDARISSTIPQTKVDMRAAGKTYEAVVYDGAGHGFMRGGEAPDASAENSAARAEAFRRLVQLLGGVR